MWVSLGQPLTSLCLVVQSLFTPRIVDYVGLLWYAWSFWIFQLYSTFLHRLPKSHLMLRYCFLHLFTATVDGSLSGDNCTTYLSASITLNHSLYYQQLAHTPGIASCWDSYWLCSQSLLHLHPHASFRHYTFGIESFVGGSISPFSN